MSSSILSNPDPLRPLAAGTPFPPRIQFQSFEALQPSQPVDFHLHTTWTDGTASAPEMALAAQARHLCAILFTEHIRHTSTYFAAYLQELQALEVSNVKIFVGAETKVLDRDGTLDIAPHIAAQCDVLVGSVHSPPPNVHGTASWSVYDAAQAVALEFELAMAIVTQSRAHILAHPMGMSIVRFGAHPLPELRALAAACAAHDKVFELNPRYCVDIATWQEIVTRAGCQVSLGSDAHRPADVGRAWDTFARTQVRV